MWGLGDYVDRKTQKAEMEIDLLRKQHPEVFEVRVEGGSGSGAGIPGMRPVYYGTQVQTLYPQQSQPLMAPQGQMPPPVNPGYQVQAPYQAQQ